MACHEYLHKKNAPNRFDLGAPTEPSGMAKELAIQGHEHEARVFEIIKATCARWVHIDAGADKDQREAQTVSALFNPEIDIILGATVGAQAEAEISRLLGLNPREGTGRVSSPDILIRDSGATGSTMAWLPVDVKSHSAIEENRSNLVWQASISETLTVEGDELQGRLREEDALQLAHYVAHLNQLGIGSGSTMAGIIGRDGCSIAWADLSTTTFGRGTSAETAIDRYLRKFAESEFVVGHAIKRNLDQTIPSPAIPMYDGNAKKCPTCEFKNVCLVEMKQYKGSGHVTLLAGITPVKAAMLAVDSIAELTNEVGVDVELVQRAKVYLSGIPEVLIGRTLVVPTFDIEIDIDLENSQAALEEIGATDVMEPDRVFLYGYIKHDRTLTEYWDENDAQSFENYGNDAEAEFEVLSSMWNYLVGVVDQAQQSGKTIGIFHYSPVERTWFRRFAERYDGRPGVPTLEAAIEFMNTYFIDLIITAKCVAFPPSKKSPLGGYSIKTLAPLVPFEWHVDDGSGAEALIRYKTAIENAPESEEARTWLRCYNWDDVRATMALRNWMRDDMVMGREVTHHTDCKVCRELASQV
jgi:CRISPR/Cas system-associated exonuclease Cas4 (RecB family)